MIPSANVWDTVGTLFSAYIHEIRVWWSTQIIMCGFMVHCTLYTYITHIIIMIINVVFDRTEHVNSSITALSQHHSSVRNIEFEIGLSEWQNILYCRITTAKSSRK